MDKRLLLELIPGPAFLIGNATGGIFVGAGFATVATVIAVFLRWRWDQRLPLMAISILALTLILLSLGLVFDDTTWVKVSNTIGSVLFAVILAGGTLLRPSLLRRTLGYSLHLTNTGWRLLHTTWICLSLARAFANEVIWRTVEDHIWATYNGLSDIGWIGVFYLATSQIARRHWDEKNTET